MNKNEWAINPIAGARAAFGLKSKRIVEAMAIFFIEDEIKMEIPTSLFWKWSTIGFKNRIRKKSWTKPIITKPTIFRVSTKFKGSRLKELPNWIKIKKVRIKKF